MCKQYRDPERKKFLNLRRLARQGNCPKNLFEIKNPEYCKDNISYWDRSEWYQYWNAYDDWRHQIAGGNYFSPAPPASFRKTYNKISRAKIKQTIREAINNDELDELCVEKLQRTIRRDYW